DCHNQSFSASTTNYPTTQYYWDMGDGTFYYTDSVYHIYDTAGDYTVKLNLVDSTSCELEDSAQTTIHIPPLFNAEVQLTDTFGCIPLSVDFESTYTNFNSLEWNFGNGQTASNNLDTNITYSQVGNFQVQLIIVDSSTCNISDTAYTNIQTINDSTRANIALDSVYFDCDSMQLNATSLNAGADSYTWIFGNGDFSTNANASTIYTAGDYNGMYMVTDNNNVCYPTDTAYFDMHLLPKLEGSFIVDTFGCLPYTSNFNAESNSDSATYFWNFGTGDFSNQEDTSYTYNNVAHYPVSVLITDSATCNIDTLLQTTVVVEEGQVYIDIQIDEINYGCDSIQVHLQAFYVGGIHEWDMGNGDILYGTDLYYTYTQLGSYTIQYNINDATQDCKPTDTTYYEIEFYRIDAILEASNTAGCIPLEVEFENLTQGNNTYWWTNGLNNVSTSPTIPNFTYTAVGNYTFTLVAIDTNSCNINDTATINITTNDDAVLADFDAVILSQCDSNLLITVDNTSQMATDYFWDYETGTSILEEIDTVQYNLPGTYTITLIATNENLCHPADTVSQQFTMLPNVKASFSATAGCEGKPIELSNTSEPNLEYAWNFGANQFSTDFEPELTYENAGSHTIQLIVTDSNSCNVTAIAYQTVNVANYPNVYFTTDSNYYLYPDAVDFHNHTTQYEGFNWKFGDGEEDSITYSPTHNYESIDEFTPCLIAWNGNCIDTFCKEIEIDFIPLIGVPNAFSPNNDGVNDIIYVEGIGIVELKFLIYNRWGELVFEGNSQNEGWDGTYKGVAQEMEVYTYVVNAKLLDGTYPVLKGNITLLR
ncbi:MAG: PKD domain-containing protein, partial [Bacteroidetes bacterium]|nr:PKD domain-containing protein [Bacteroidota bacterium]